MAEGQLFETKIFDEGHPQYCFKGLDFNYALGVKQLSLNGVTIHTLKLY